MNTQSEVEKQEPVEAETTPAPVTLPSPAPAAKPKAAATPPKRPARTPSRSSGKTTATAKASVAPRASRAPKANAKIAPSVAKVITKAPRKAVAKPAPKVVATPKAAPAIEVVQKKKVVKAKKAKMVRDSFTMPQSEYDLIATVKKRCVANGFAVKKSEVLRAAVIRFAALSDVQVMSALDALEVIKTGRPPKGPK